MRFGSATQRVSPERVDEALRAVLERPEFQARADEEPPFLRYLRELFDGSPTVGVAGDVAFWLAVVAGAALIGWSVVALASRLEARPARGRGAAGVERQPAERVRDLCREAAAARAAGDRRLALRLYFFALVVGLGARGDLDYDDAWTNRELVERGEPTPELRAWLAPLVGELDELVFGPRAPAAGDVDRVAELVRAHLGPGVADPSSTGGRA